MMLLFKDQDLRFKYIKSAKKEEVSLKIISYFYIKTPYILKSIFSIIKSIFNSFLLRKMTKENWKNTKAKNTFVSYSCNMVPESIDSGNFSSYYWGGFTDL